MPLPVYHLRRLLALTATLLTVVVAGMYFYARSRTRNVLKEVPNKIGYDIKQTANGFQFSKSDGKRTLFIVQASTVKEFKLNGRAELRNVSIVLYGRDSSRYDRIYGENFSYDQKTGEVSAKGQVQIDLMANPAGLVSPDQSAPREARNPIHLDTRDLIFNRNTGNAETDARVEFRTPQATGWAIGAKYAGRSNTLILPSEIHVTLLGSKSAVIDADRAVITGEPRQILLDHPRVERNGETLQADQADLYLTAENNVERALATGNVVAQTYQKATNKGAQKELKAGINARADQAEFALAGEQNLLRNVVLSGHAHVEQPGPQAIEGDAGRLIFDFAGQNELQTIHAIDGVRLSQKSEIPRSKNGKGPGTLSSPQDFELRAPIINFTVANGKILQRAVTSGAAQIIINSMQPQGPDATNHVSARASRRQETTVTAGKFEAAFASVDGKNHLVSLRGAPDAHIVNVTAGEPDRTSTSDSVDAVFLPQGGIESVTQQGNVVYSDNQPRDKRTQAWAEVGHYTPADQVLVLTGNPRVSSGAMRTTAATIRINRATGDAVAEGDVKSTYSELKEQPNGALLASSSPIHVTARSMTAHKTAGIALYNGNARLWQDANVVEAPTIQFDRERRFVVAQGTPSQPVKTILVQSEKPGSAPYQSSGSGNGAASVNRFEPITITSTQLSYTDSEHRVHYAGGVEAKSTDFIATAKTADAYLLPRDQTPHQVSNNQSFSSPGQLDRMVAQGDVVIQQPNRKAEGQQLVFTAADQKFVLTGGPPCIFDAERGKITGVSLTFFKRDDRVLVEGEASTPVVTQTRVAQ
jgi:lipopolysaccharide export system protein LptA